MRDGAERGSAPGPSLLKSSTLRSAVLAALAVWAPGAVLISLHHSDWTRHVLETAAGERDELAEEVLEGAREHRFLRFEDELGEPLDELEEIDDETAREFRERYVEHIREEARYRGDEIGLRLRLAMLGEADGELLAQAPLEALSELMEDEVPEDFHDLLEDLFEPHYEAQEEAFDDVEVGALELVALIEDEELLEEAGACLRVTDAGGRPMLSSFDRVARAVTIDGRFTAARLAGAEAMDGGLEPWCLIEERPLADGGRLLIGPRIDRRYRLIRHSAARRNLLLALGLPLALAAGWLQSRPIARFLAALGSAARRQERGEAGARLQITPDGRDLGFAVDTINRMLARLEQTMQGLSRVSDSIAHDLRTPLSRLQGQLDLLKQSSDPSGELIEAVQDEADQLLQTFNALLRIARVESGTQRQGFRRIDFAEIVHDVADLYAPVFAEKDIAFTVGVPRRRVDGEGDRDLWLQALSNLVENALKYTPEGGRVELQLDDRRPRPRIRLADSGPGIPEPERENVFRRFYRLQRHRGERGSGLGLSLVGAVCDLHGAEIRLGGDRGLTVEIDLAPESKPLQPSA